MSETGKDIYRRVTDQIVAELEKGVRPWFKPWNADHAAERITRPLRANGIPYRGINVLMLWASATERGFAAPLWLTYKQAQELGGQVQKGEKGSLVVYANTITRTETDETTGEDLEREIPFMKGYTVFNAEQVDGLPAHFYAMQQPALDIVVRIEKAEAFFAATGAEINEGSNNLAMTRYLIEEANAEIGPDRSGRWPTIIAAECEVDAILSDYILEAETNISRV